ncbi:DMT family transporter [Rhizobium sp. SSA_523]|uniref:DMT family transporter n=1 Tax=Rhizobium sp. SSA_523 TaxID=2952477 RepID=UPI002091568F|nr:DMT family transporter [Rhizobium sp. SSA_523]MCO5732872.1 DMT family transporter [Rhizobium sp. SSA_523]WKC23511.1 DMT family transporter [Rhizobium sp. SSA_523]
MLLGILAGLTTCALWGLTFVAARLVHPFSLFDITIGRYAVFGLTCLLTMLHPRLRLRGIGASRIITGMMLGIIGYVGYFVLASQAVILAGPVVPPLIIGIMPVILPAIANLMEQTIAWRKLLLPLAMIAAGIAAVNLDLVSRLDLDGQRMMLAGAGCAVAALLVWVLYGIINARIMRASQPPSAMDWTNLHGMGALLGAIALLPMASDTYATVPQEILLRFLLWAVVLGMAASWLATWCWSVASQRLPLALTAQLIVAETIFGLIFGLCLDGRFPTPVEGAGAALQIAGVSLAVHAFTRPRATGAAPSAG